MTRSELNTALAAILTTALETEPDGFPESMAYIALGSDMGKWTMVKTILVDNRLATFDGYHIQLTERGRELARKCNAARAA